MEKFNSSVAIQVLPSSANSSTKEVVRIVDEVIAYIAKSGVHYVVTPFETVMEGEYENLMSIAKEAIKIATDAGADSVMAYLKVNFKPKGEVLTIEEKCGKYEK